MNQQMFEQELQDLRRLARFARRFGWKEVMTESEIQERATLLASSDGVAAHYQSLREEAARITKPKTWIPATKISYQERKQIGRAVRHAQQIQKLK